MPDSSWADPEGDRPHPWKIGFLSILVRFPLKSQSYQASIRCWAISGTPAKRHLNGVSLAGQWWPAYSGVWILTPIINLKKVVKVGPLSGSAHAAEQLCFMCEVRFPTLKTARGMKAADLIFMSAADIISRQVWPRPGPTKCLKFVFITKALIRICGTPADLRLCWSHTTKSGYNIYRRVVRMFTNPDMYVTADHLKVFCCFH